MDMIGVACVYTVKGLFLGTYLSRWRRAGGVLFSQLFLSV